MPWQIGLANIGLLKINYSTNLMFMGKKNLIIVIIILFIIAAFGFGVYFLLSGKNQNPASNSTSYTLSVTKNDVNISATLTSGGATAQLDENALSKYALVSLNSTSDILWFECPQGYTYANPLSTTGNKITQDPLLSEVNIEIFAGKQNNLTVTCNKNP